LPASLSVHPAARQAIRRPYSGAHWSPSSSLAPEAVREVIGGEPDIVRADPA